MTCPEWSPTRFPARLVDEIRRHPWDDPVSIFVIALPSRTAIMVPRERDACLRTSNGFDLPRKCLLPTGCHPSPAPDRKGWGRQSYSPRAHKSCHGAQRCSSPKEPYSLDHRPELPCSQTLQRTYPSRHPESTASRCGQRRLSTVWRSCRSGWESPRGTHHTVRVSPG